MKKNWSNKQFSSLLRRKFWSKGWWTNRKTQSSETDWWIRKNETWSLKAESENEQAGEWFLIRLKRRRQKRVWTWRGKNLAVASINSINMNFVCNLMEQRGKVMKNFQDPYSKAKETHSTQLPGKRRQGKNNSC